MRVIPVLRIGMKWNENRVSFLPTEHCLSEAAQITDLDRHLQSQAPEVR